MLTAWCADKSNHDLRCIITIFLKRKFVNNVKYYIWGCGKGNDISSFFVRFWVGHSIKGLCIPRGLPFHTNLLNAKKEKREVSKKVTYMLMEYLKPKLDSRWTSWYQGRERRIVAEVAVFVVGMKGV